MEREFANETQGQRLRDNSELTQPLETALFRSDNQLRVAYELFETVTAGAEAIIAAVDLQLCYIFFNQSYREEIRRLTGKEPKLGHSIKEVFAHMPEQQAIAVQEWSRTLLGGDRSQYRIEFGDPARHRRIYSVRRTPIRNSTGQVIAAGEVAWDVTEVVRMERALRASEERLRVIGDNIPGGATYQNVTLPDGTVSYTYISSGVERLFGVTAQSVMQDAATFRQLIVEEDRPRIAAVEQAALRDSTPFDCEFRWRTVGGDIRWVHCRSTAQRSEDGSIVWSGVLTDITARKQAEADARAQQVRLGMALEAAGMVTWEWDIPTHTIRYSDNIAAIVRGAAVEPYCSLDTLMPRIHPKDREPLTQALKRSSEQGVPFECEYRAHMLDGTFRWILGKGKRVVVEGGIPVAVLGLSIDITERKRAEDLRRHQQKLESIGRLARGVAHEIKNPLTGIIGFAQLIEARTDKTDPWLGEYAAKIIRLAEHAATMVHSLLTFARRETQSHSPADIRETIRATLALIQMEMMHDRITVEVDIPETLPAIKCRSQQIQQVLMNLLTNARDGLNEKYPGGDPDKLMRVTAQALEKAGKVWIRTTVEDHGTGISPEIQERMFDPFFTTKEQDKGTGLGLAISHGIVEEHGGELHCESEPGRWTRFHLDLPAASNMSYTD